MKHTTNIRKGLNIMTAVLLFSLPVTVSASDATTSGKSNSFNNAVSSEQETMLSYSMNYSKKEKGMLVVRKKGCNDWSYILQDSTGTIIYSHTCMNQTDTVFGLTEGEYSISEVNPYGIGSSQSFKLSNRFRTKFCNIPSDERSLIQLTEENDWRSEIEQNSAIEHNIIKKKLLIQESTEKNNIL